MTSSETIIAVLALSLLFFVISRYMKDDKWFLIPVAALLTGAFGGALMNKLDGKSSNEVNVSTTQVYNPTQVSPANCVDFYTVLGDTQAYKANPASKVIEVPVCDSSVDYAPSVAFGEIRGQPTQNVPFDTS